MPQINYLAVLISGVAAMIIGGIWYGPLFGNLWMKGMGWDTNDEALKARMKKSAGPAYVQMFILALIQAYVLAHIFWAFTTALPPMSPIAAALQSGIWTWFGLVVPVKYGDKLWGGKQFKYVGIDLGYYLVVLIVMSLIFAFWK